MTDLGDPNTMFTPAWHMDKTQEKVDWAYTDARRAYARGTFIIAAAWQEYAAMLSAIERQSRNLE